MTNQNKKWTLIIILMSVITYLVNIPQIHFNVKYPIYFTPILGFVVGWICYGIIDFLFGIKKEY